MYGPEGPWAGVGGASFEAARAEAGTQTMSDAATQTWTGPGHPPAPPGARDGGSSARRSASPSPGTTRSYEVGSGGEPVRGGPRVHSVASGSDGAPPGDSVGRGGPAAPHTTSPLVDVQAIIAQSARFRMVRHILVAARCPGLPLPVLPTPPTFPPALVTPPTPHPPPPTPHPPPPTRTQIPPPHRSFTLWIYCLDLCVRGRWSACRRGHRCRTAVPGGRPEGSWPQQAAVLGAPCILHLPPRSTGA